MNLEKHLFDTIKILTQEKSLKSLRSVNKNLSKKYSQLRHRFFESDEERLAYITSRMPATFSALNYVFKQMQKIDSTANEIKTVLDLGSGPATAAWAVFNKFENIQKVFCLEKDQKLIAYAKQMLKQTPFFNKIEFEKNNIAKIKKTDFDLVILSYVTTELKDVFVKITLNKWIASSSSFLVVVEPGTKEGFKKIKFIRKYLLDNNLFLIAPCPHLLKCPMPKADWCHFYVRTKRTKPHKYLKSASLGYEDEKFSYVIATKHEVKLPLSRCLRFPSRGVNKIQLTLCKNGKILEETVEKKEKQRFKVAKKINWGDAFDV